MPSPNTGYWPHSVEGVGGITVSQTGGHIRVGNGPGGGQQLARGIVVPDGEGAATWAGPHPGFSDTITVNGAGDYTLTMLGTDDASSTAFAFANIQAADEGPTVTHSFSFQRPSSSVVRVFITGEGVSGVDLSFSAVAFGDPLLIA